MMDIQRAIHVLQDCADAAKGTEFAQVYQMAISAFQERDMLRRALELALKSDKEKMRHCPLTVLYRGKTVLPEKCIKCHVSADVLLGCWIEYFIQQAQEEKK